MIPEVQYLGADRRPREKHPERIPTVTIETLVERIEHTQEIQQHKVLGYGLCAVGLGLEALAASLVGPACCDKKQPEPPPADTTKPDPADTPEKKARIAEAVGKFERLLAGAYAARTHRHLAWFAETEGPRWTGSDWWYAIQRRNDPARTRIASLSICQDGSVLVVLWNSKEGRRVREYLRKATSEIRDPIAGFEHVFANLGTTDHLNAIAAHLATEL